MDKDNFFIKSQISSNIQNVINLINTGVFVADIVKVFREPVFISIILKLDDLLQKFDKLNCRIDFIEDISVKDLDITDLVNKIRNTAFHLSSPENMLDKKSQIKFVFNMINDKAPNAISIDGVSYGADYEDDIAFFYGEYRIYLKRHIIRLLQESREIYKKLYNEEIRL